MDLLFAHDEKQVGYDRATVRLIAKEAFPGNLRGQPRGTSGKEDREKQWVAMRMALVVLFLVARGGAVFAAEYLSWGDYVTISLDTLINRGTDRYGPVRTAMLMSILDVETLESPEKPQWLDTEAYYEPGRAHRRAMAGSNFWYDQATIRAMYAVSRATGDPKYARAADRAIGDFFKCHSNRGFPT